MGWTVLTTILEGSAMQTDSMLFHITRQENLARIAQEGLRGFVYLSQCNLVNKYYASTVEDEGSEAIYLAVRHSSLAKTKLAPDWEGVEEPIMTPIRDRSGLAQSYTQEDLWRDWEATDRSWEACLKLLGTLRYEDSIQPEHLYICHPDESLEPLAACIAKACI